eukprot:1941952-Pleurochrysis_carterae.AAC.1
MDDYVKAEPMNERAQGQANTQSLAATELHPRGLSVARAGRSGETANPVRPVRMMRCSWFVLTHSSS